MSLELQKLGTTECERLCPSVDTTKLKYDFRQHVANKFVRDLANDPEGLNTIPYFPKDKITCIGITKNKQGVVVAITIEAVGFTEPIQIFP